MIKVLRIFLGEHKYTFLLFSLIAHLYIGIIITDDSFYLRVVWPLNMLLLGIASVGVFIEKNHIKTTFQNILSIIAFLLPVSIPFLGATPDFLIIISIFYFLFFGFIFYEIITFLIKPSYFNADIIIASACGYFLLIEIMVFLLETLYYYDPSMLSHVNQESVTEVYMDLVYFSSISLTTIGYGDIFPSSHVTKLIISFFGIVGKFYEVVLVGIIISKFASIDLHKKRKNL
ncbi:two pore domain potassium channel family protein [Flavobacteriaceae bacterium Ap0902]|nr:two pore domain potassium channel family protein [Flavobacteriaceae bacterium Ap0902]